MILEKWLKFLWLRTTRAKPLWSSRARYRTSWLEESWYSPSPLLCSWGCSHVLQKCTNSSWLKSLQSIHMDAWGTAGAEMWHCGKKAGSVSKIWALVSPVFHLHWAWTKSFPITWGGTSELPQLWKDFGRTKTSEDRAGNYPNHQNSPVELTGQFPYLNLALNIFLMIVCNSAGSSSIATLCSSLLMVFFWKWQNLLKCFWALLVLAAVETLAQLQGRSFGLWQK